MRLTDVEENFRYRFNYPIPLSLTRSKFGKENFKIGARTD
jgi:hypothetical protein